MFAGNHVVVALVLGGWITPAGEPDAVELTGARNRASDAPLIAFEKSRLIPSMQEFTNQFGRHIDVDGNTAYIGATGEDVPAGSNRTGAVYSFERNGDTWTETGEILSHSSTRSDFGRVV